VIIMELNILVYVCLGFGLTAALVGGVFQSFSDFVMRGLAQAGPGAGAASMIGLNRTVFRSFFLVMLLALAPLGAAFAIYALFYVSGSAKILLITASVIYVTSVFIVTVAGNVPRNEKLDRLAGEGAAAYWPTYFREWTSLNHARTWGSVATAVCYLLAAVHI
jgi:uncharacterized membrane protein